MGFSFIKKAAPWIGTLISAAVPGAAPFVNIASNLLSASGAKVPPTVQGVSDAVTGLMATPEGLAKLREIDDQVGVQMKTLGIESVEHLEQLADADRASARAMQVEVKSKMPAVLAASAVVTFFFCIYMLGFRTMPDSGHDALLILLGAVVATYKDVYGYVFGSSAGSDRKTEILASQTVAAQTTGAKP